MLPVDFLAISVAVAIVVVAVDDLQPIIQIIISSATVITADFVLLLLSLRV